MKHPQNPKKTLNNMINMLAICLVLVSLVTAGIWSPSPSPPPHDDHQQVIVKEGHRVVVVEYDKEVDGSTKVLISPHEVSHDDDMDEEKKPEGMFSGPRELVCDAYGKCKHKIASAIGKTKDKEHAKEAAGGVYGKAKDKVYEYEERAKEAANEAKEKLSEKVTGQTIGGQTIGESLGKAKDTVSHGIDKAKKVTGDVVSTVKDAASKDFDVVDSPKRMGEDIQRNVTGKIEESAEPVKERAKETVHNVQKSGQKSLSEILSKLKEITYDVIWYILSRDKVDAVVGLIHMLGFSTAYGMCVWVTFVSSYILGRYLPRQQFGMLQSRIYTVYFKAMAYCVSTALLGYLASQKNSVMTRMMDMFQGLSLLSALIMVLTNMIVLEPKATKLMYEIMKIEKEDGRGVAVAARDVPGDNGGTTVLRPVANVVAERHDVPRLNEKLKRLNTYSSALNVSTLVALTWHIAYMGQRLQATH